MRSPNGPSLHLLQELRAAGKTVVVVHHDLQTVPEYFDWVALLNVRRIASGPVEEGLHRRKPAPHLRRPAGAFPEPPTWAASPQEWQLPPALR
jgi:energy-coupling factor transporter ATP-binding protein EcfA2